MRAALLEFLGIFVLVLVCGWFLFAVGHDLLAWWVEGREWRRRGR